MDKETKKTISDLCCSVNAMKAEIETLKNGATSSGRNPAGSQDSDIVSGISPPNMGRKTASEESNSEEGLEEEPFVDLRGRICQTVWGVLKFIEAAFKTKLKNSECWEVWSPCPPLAEMPRPGLCRGSDDPCILSEGR